MIILIILLLFCRIDYQVNCPPYLDSKVRMTLRALAIQLSPTFASFRVFFLLWFPSAFHMKKKNPFLIEVLIKEHLNMLMTSFFVIIVSEILPE